MTDRHLVLGLAAGLHYADVRPFVASLRHCHPASETQCDCVLFISPNTTGVERMQSHGVQIVPFERPREFAHVPYNAWRYFLYRDYLLERYGSHAETDHWVLISDVRDVVFQCAFWEHPWGVGLNVTLEDEGMRIGDCPYMSRWAAHHLGQEALDAMAGERISCSGTTVARPLTMLDYLERLCQRLLPYTPAPHTAGYDQAVHNHMLYTGIVRPVFRHDNSGPILTLGYKPTEPLRDASGYVLNDAGQPARIVHQYDRMPTLFKEIRQRYGQESRGK